MFRVIQSLAFLLISLDLAQGYWQPSVGTTWQIVLSKTLSSNDTALPVAALDFDAFDNSASTVAAARNAGKKTICYFSAGSWENWRPDQKQFNKADLGKPLDGWPGERWLNTRSASVRKIMGQRMDMAKQKGCDAIDPDNIDVFDNGGGGFGLTRQDAVNYVQFLAAEGHKRGMAVGLKNGGALIKDVLNVVDFQVNEQCEQYNECDTFRPFITAGKPVFHIEYRSSVTSQAVNTICNTPSAQGFSTVIKHMNLDQWVIFCGSQSSAKTVKPRDPNLARRNIAPSKFAAAAGAILGSRRWL